MDWPRIIYKRKLLPNVERMQSLSVRARPTALVEMNGTILRITFSSRGQDHVNYSTITSDGRQLGTDCWQIHLSSHLLVVLCTDTRTHICTVNFWLRESTVMNNNNSSTTGSKLLTNDGPSAFQLAETMSKSNKI